MRPVHVQPEAPAAFWRCGSCQKACGDEDDARACCDGPRGDGLKWGLWGGALPLLVFVDIQSRLPLRAFPAHLRWLLGFAVVVAIAGGAIIGYRLSRKPRARRVPWRERIHTRRGGNVMLAIQLSMFLPAAALLCNAVPPLNGMEAFAVMVASACAAIMLGNRIGQAVEDSALRRDPSLDRCGERGWVCEHPLVVAARSAMAEREGP